MYCSVCSTANVPFQNKLQLIIGSVWDAWQCSPLRGTSVSITINCLPLFLPKLYSRHYTLYTITLYTLHYTLYAILLTLYTIQQSPLQLTACSSFCKQKLYSRSNALSWRNVMQCNATCKDAFHLVFKTALKLQCTINCLLLFLAKLCSRSNAPGEISSDLYRLFVCDIEK